MPAGEARRFTLFPQWLNSFHKPPRGVRLNRQHQLAQGLVLDWVLNEAAGVRCFDSVLPSAPDAPANTGLFGAGGAQPTWDAGGLRFDGGDTITLDPLRAPVGGFPLTLMCALTFTGGTGATRTYLSVSNAAASNLIGLGFNSSNNLDYFGVTLDAIGPAVVLNERAVMTGRSQSGTAHALYRNAQSVASAATSESPAGWDRVWLGHLNAAEQITGLVAWARIWNRALFDDEIQWVYDEPFDLYEPLPYQRFFFLQAPAAGGPSPDQLAPVFAQQRSAPALGAAYV